jgi:hypothetical protein
VATMVKAPTMASSEFFMMRFLVNGLENAATTADICRTR